MLPRATPFLLLLCWCALTVDATAQAAPSAAIDIRDNAGGNLHNQPVTLLSGKTYFQVAPHAGGPAQDEPRDRWTKPSVVVTNAANYSYSSLRCPCAVRTRTASARVKNDHA